jgi:hypothetical protein
MMQQQPRGIVLMNDVVLNVERALGMVRERDEAANASSPDASKRIPERFLLVCAAATRWPSAVVSGLRSASLRDF